MSDLHLHQLSLLGFNNLSHRVLGILIHHYARKYSWKIGKFNTEAEGFSKLLRCLKINYKDCLKNKHNLDIFKFHNYYGGKVFIDGPDSDISDEIEVTNFDICALVDFLDKCIFLPTCLKEHLKEQCRNFGKVQCKCCEVCKHVVYKGVTPLDNCSCVENKSMCVRCCTKCSEIHGDSNELSVDCCTICHCHCINHGKECPQEGVRFAIRVLLNIRHLSAHSNCDDIWVKLDNGDFYSPNFAGCSSWAQLWKLATDNLTGIVTYLGDEISKEELNLINSRLEHFGEMTKVNMLRIYHEVIKVERSVIDRENHEYKSLIASLKFEVPKEIDIYRIVDMDGDVSTTTSTAFEQVVRQNVGADIKVTLMECDLDEGLKSNTAKVKLKIQGDTAQSKKDLMQYEEYQCEKSKDLRTYIKNEVKAVLFKNNITVSYVAINGWVSSSLYITMSLVRSGSAHWTKEQKVSLENVLKNIINSLFSDVSVQVQIISGNNPVHKIHFKFSLKSKSREQLRSIDLDFLEVTGTEILERIIQNYHKSLQAQTKPSQAESQLTSKVPIKASESQLEPIPDVQEKITGYDFEYLQDMSNVKCPKCLCILRQTSKLPCGHKYCSYCLEKLEQEHPNDQKSGEFRCATCLSVYKKEQVYMDQHLDEVIKTGYQVRCQLYNLSCPWTGTISEFFEVHEKECPMKEIQCGNIGCDVTQMRKDMEQHLKHCLYRTVSCEYCFIEVLCIKLEEHHKVCDEVPLKGYNKECSISLQREQIKGQSNKQYMKVNEDDKNEIRLVLLRRKMTECVRRKLHEKLPENGNQLYQVLYQHKDHFERLRKTGKLGTAEFEILFPQNKYTQSSLFNISLIIKLLFVETLCGYRHPGRGWKTLDTDNSDVANFTRIKSAINLMAHLGSAVDKIIFDEIFNLAQPALIAFNISKEEIDKIRNLKIDETLGAIFFHNSITYNLTIPVANFIGREEKIREIHDKLVAIDQSKKKYAVIIHGLTGVGKSETIRKYCKDYGKYYNDIFWINAKSKKSTENCFNDVATKLQIPTVNKSGKKIAMNLVIDSVYSILADNRNRRVLFVFDNIEKMEEIKEFLPSNQQMSPLIIATSQSKQWDDQRFEIIHLDVFNEDISDQFLQNELETPASPGDRFDLLSRLQCHPLALQHAVSYINFNEMSIQEYLKIYNSNDLICLKMENTFEERSASMTVKDWKKEHHKVYDELPLKGYNKECSNSLQREQIEGQSNKKYMKVIEDDKNEIRLALLRRKMTECVRRKLHEKLPENGNQLYQVLDQHRDHLMKKGHLSKNEFNILFPQNKFTQSSLFDISLIIKLLFVETLCGYRHPGRGWKPLDTDNSDVANFTRIELVRNLIQHLGSAVDKIKFNEIFDLAQPALIALNISQEEIDKIRYVLIDETLVAKFFHKELYKDLERKQSQILGKTHPSVLTTGGNIATHIKNIGDVMYSKHGSKNNTTWHKKQT